MTQDPSGHPAPQAPAEPPTLASGETVLYEGGPARGDLILSLLIGLTLIGLPIAVGAVVRALWLRYRITSRRISVSGGWLGRDRTQVVYSQIREVLSVPRGFGAWGDMVLVLNDGSRLEMRSVPRFRELEAYIEERRQSRPPADAGGRTSAGFGETTRATA
ncbi:MAG: PH domain-containing protein [Synechococcaceae cyanobacterium]|nr:PH domain-containing protein [Synechococcaceae cyanobacterium]